MDKDYLLKTARQLKQVDKKSAAEYSAKRDSLVAKMNEKMVARQDIENMVGKNNLEMMKDNHANHARFLESIFMEHSPEILVDTVTWVFKAYKARSFNLTYWAAQLNGWIDLYKKELSEGAFNAIQPYYVWMQVNIPTFSDLADKSLEKGNSEH